MSKMHDRLSNLHLPEEVFNKALEINNILPESLKHMKENARAYLIVTEAYRSLNIIYDVKQLAESLALSVKRAKDTLKDATRRGYRLTIHQYSPIQQVDDLLYIAGLDQTHKESIVALLEKVLNIYPELKEENPTQVCASTIMYYAPINGFEIDSRNFCTHCHIPIATTETIRTLVEIVDNQ